MCCNSPHTSWNSWRNPRSSSPPKVQVVNFCTKQKNDLQLGACLKSWKVKFVVSSSSTSKFENHSNPDLPAVQARTVSASSEEVHLLYVRILLKPRIQTPRELVKSVGPYIICKHLTTAQQHKEFGRTIKFLLASGAASASCDSISANLANYQLLWSENWRQENRN